MIEIVFDSTLLILPLLACLRSPIGCRPVAIGEYFPRGGFDGHTWGTEVWG